MRWKRFLQHVYEVFRIRKRHTRVWRCGVCGDISFNYSRQAPIIRMVCLSKQKFRSVCLCSTVVQHKVVLGPHESLPNRIPAVWVKHSFSEGEMIPSWEMRASVGYHKYWRVETRCTSPSQAHCRLSCSTNSGGNGFIKERLYSV